MTATQSAAAAAVPDERAPRWLDDEERAAWLSIVRVAATLPAALDVQLERDEDLNYFEYIVLAMLSEQPDLVLRMSALAALTNASLSRLSHVAKRLEGRGLIRREPDPSDGRCTNAILTEEGLAKVRRAAPGTSPPSARSSWTPCPRRSCASSATPTSRSWRGPTPRPPPGRHPDLRSGPGEGRGGNPAQADTTTMVVCPILILSPFFSR